jgi:hypothetical protein
MVRIWSWPDTKVQNARSFTSTPLCHQGMVHKYRKNFTLFTIGVTSYCIAKLQKWLQGIPCIWQSLTSFPYPVALERCWDLHMFHVWMAMTLKRNKSPIPVFHCNFPSLWHLLWQSTTSNWPIQYGSKFCYVFCVHTERMLGRLCLSISFISKIIESVKSSPHSHIIFL